MCSVDGFCNICSDKGHDKKFRLLPVFFAAIFVIGSAIPLLTHIHVKIKKRTLSVTHIHTHTHTHSLTHITHSHIHSHSHSHTLTHTHSLTHNHTHTHTHTHSLTHALTLTHTVTHSHTHSLTHILTHTHTHTHSHTPTHSHTLTHSLTHTHTHTHSHMHSHTHSHSHTLSHTLTHTLTHTHSHIHSHTLTLTHSHTHTLKHTYVVWCFNISRGKQELQINNFAFRYICAQVTLLQIYKVFLSVWPVRFSSWSLGSSHATTTVIANWRTKQKCSTLALPRLPCLRERGSSRIPSCKQGCPKYTHSRVKKSVLELFGHTLYVYLNFKY